MWEFIIVLVFTLTMFIVGIIASVKSFRLSHPPHEHDEDHGESHDTPEASSTSHGQ